MAEKGVGVAVRRGKTSASSPARAATRTTSTSRARPTPTSCASRMPTPASRGIDKASAEGVPGVLAVFTGEDVKAEGSAT